MDYGEVLKKGWDITWKNKGLWLLGILSGCSSGAGNPSQGFQWTTSGQDFPGLERSISGVPEETWILIAVGLVCLILLFAAAAIVLGILGQAGLMAGVSHADETGSVKLGEAWRLGLPHFWRLLGVAAIVVAVVLVLALLFGFLAVISFGMVALCILPILCLAIPLGIVVSGYMSLVQNGIVLERKGVFEGFGSGWELLRANFWPVVLVAVILAVIGIVAGVAISLPLFIAALPLMAVALSQPDPELAAFLPLIGCFVLYLPVLIILGGILKTYVSSVWTLTYRRLTGMGLSAVAVPATS